MKLLYSGRYNIPMHDYLRFLRIPLFVLALLFAAYAIIPIHTANAPAPLVATSTPATTTPAAISAYEWYPVVHVVDGDTIDIQKDGKKVRVRFIGIDTPEVVDQRKPVQCFGQEASQEMHTLVDGTSVRIETDPSQDTYDKYGRLLAYVYAPANVQPEGILINEYMIAQGYAHEYTYRLPYKYQKEFKAAEAEAREGQRGLWAPGVCEKT